MLQGVLALQCAYTCFLSPAQVSGNEETNEERCKWSSSPHSEEESSSLSEVMITKKKRAASDPKVASDEEASGAGGNGGAGGTASTSERRDLMDRFARLMARGAAVRQGAAGTAILDELCQHRNAILVEKKKLDDQVKQLDMEKVDFDKAIAMMGKYSVTQQVKPIGKHWQDYRQGEDSEFQVLEEGLEAEAAEGHAEGSECEQSDSGEREIFFAKEQQFKQPGPYTTKSIVMHRCREGVIHKNGNLTHSWQGGPVGLPKRKPPNIGNLCRYWQQFRGCKNGSNCKWFHDKSLEHKQRTLYVDRKPQHMHCGKLRTHHHAPLCS